MLQSILNDLKASIRDIVLAGVAAGVGVLLASELPRSLADAKVLVVAAVYAAIRAAVGYIAAKLAD